MRSLLLSLAMIFIALISSTTSATTDVSNDQIAIQAVIADQLSAFAGDDNERAYSHVSPRVKHKITNAQQFMHMVKHAYKALYQAAEYQFARHAKVDQQIMQEVLIEDEYGKLWRAFYALNKTKNDEWKIYSVEIQALKVQRI